LLTKGKNFWFADFDGGASGGKRLYFPWDLDAVLGKTNSSIYRARNNTLSDYEKYITENPTFRAQYNQIMLDLLNGPLAVAPTLSFLDQLEATLTPSLLADSNTGFGNTPDAVAGEFDRIRDWMVARHANVLQQVQADMAQQSSAAVPEPSLAALLTAGAAALGVGSLWRRRSKGLPGAGSGRTGR
jgi:hypothetical protein